ncbi:MAG: class I SAM-dependent methyltransferase [Deltaproteobacteria bacterium]|nr:class I SAM-dependent methyltransferase [Deltaproteobacteria bacterium]
MITVDFDRLRIRPGFRVLDVGCGTGRHTCAASRRDRVVAVGMDINFDDAKEARKRLQYEKALGAQAGMGATLVADITRLPFRDHAFDLVICSEVLEHIPDEERAIDELARVVKKGRDLVVSVPRYLPERICWALSTDYYRANGGHIRIYRKKELVRRLEGAGVRRWAAHFAHGLHTPYWWLKCLVGPTREDSMPVNLYHRFLVWDMMKRTWMSRFLEYLLNPLTASLSESCF